MDLTVLNEAYKKSYYKKYKCPYCDKRLERKALVKHIEKRHQELIPDGYTPTRVAFNAINNKEHGTCVMCHKESPWNEDKGRYDRLCGSKKCHDEYTKMVEERIKRIHGKSKKELMEDPEFQKKMLAGRSISGTYKMQDGTEKTYTGTYELNFIKFMDVFLNVKSEDIEMPGPIIEYEYKGKKCKWITDAYYAPYNLVFDIKDGGDNPNNREMAEYREKQIEKEKAIQKQGQYNYIRLTDNKFEQLIDMMIRLKELYIDDTSEYKPIVSINEKSYIEDFVIQEKLLFSEENLYIEFDKFKSGESNIILITGMSGSGKSTLGEKLSTEYKAKLIQLDIFDNVLMMSADEFDALLQNNSNDKPIQDFGKLYKEYRNSRHCDELIKKIFKDKDTIPYLEYANAMANDFLQYSIKHVKKNKNDKYIFEGIQVYKYLTKNDIKDIPIIFISTSATASFVRRLKRSYEKYGISTFIKELNDIPSSISWYLNDNKKFENLKSEFVNNPIKESANLSDFTWYHLEIMRKGFNPKINHGWDEELYSKSMDSAIINDIKDKFPEDKDEVQAHVFTAGEELSSIYLGIITVYKYDDKFDWEWSEQEPISSSMVSYLKDEVHKHLLENSDILIEASYEDILNKTIDTLKSLGKDPKIDKKGKEEFIKTGKTSEWRGSLCISGLGNEGLNSVCSKVNKEIKPMGARLSPDNYGTAFLKIKESVLLSEETKYSTKDKYPVFIVLMHSGTLLGNIIRKVTDVNWSHALISFNEKLEPFYSFGEKNDGGYGLTVQKITDKFYTKYKPVYRVFVSYVNKNAMEKMKARLDWFAQREAILKYDILGLIDYAFGRQSENHAKYFCSRFVMDIISQGQKLTRFPSLWSPQDIENEFSNITLVNQGDDFSQYDYKKTDKNLQFIKKGQFNKIKLDPLTKILVKEGTVLSTQPCNMWIVNYLQNTPFAGEDINSCYAISPTRDMESIYLYDNQLKAIRRTGLLSFMENNTILGVYRTKNKITLEEVLDKARFTKSFYSAIDEYTNDISIDKNYNFEKDDDNIISEIQYIKESMITTMTKLKGDEFTVKIPYIPYINESYIDDKISYYHDLDGIYVENNESMIRSKSYSRIEDIPTGVIEIVRDGYKK